MSRETILGYNFLHQAYRKEYQENLNEKAAIFCCFWNMLMGGFCSTCAHYF
jgi:hypothetical protein